MADATFDAVIVGGGNKGLVIAMYLSKYAGMEVGIFERRHELGGGWCSEELAPGFICNPHAQHQNWEFQFKPLEYDFDILNYGVSFYEPDVALGAIFAEDQSCILNYHAKKDPTGERTAKSISQFSQRDAETYSRFVQKAIKVVYPILVASQYNPPPLPGQPSEFQTLLAKPEESGLDPRWLPMTPLEVAIDMFENDCVRKLPFRIITANGISVDWYMCGLWYPMLIILGNTMCAIKGGTHQLAHAAHRILVENKVKMFTRRHVEKIIMENGKATGIKLADGTQVTARKCVVTNVDPWSLIRLIGEENVREDIRRRVANIRADWGGITWYTWGLHERPLYKAAAYNPDISKAAWLWLTNKDLLSLSKYDACRRLNMFPPQIAELTGETSLMTSLTTLYDDTMAPPGKCVILTETAIPDARKKTEEEWLEYHKAHAEFEIKNWNKFASNITWDNVVGYHPETPYTVAKRLINMPTGIWVLIDHTPHQMGSMRPIPELARYKVPDISQLYCTGSAWHPGASGTCAQGYNCYKIMADDMDLGKPWKVAGREW